MRWASLCLPLALLFLANVIPSKAQRGSSGAAAVAAEAAASAAGAEAEAEASETRVTVAAGAPLALECRLRPEQRAEWRRDGGALPGDLRVEPEAPAADGRLAARLRAPAARARHAGLYTCSRERDQRVRLLVLPAAPRAGEATTDAGGLVTDDAALPELLYDVRGNITLLCDLPNEGSLEYVWKKNGTAVEQTSDLKGRYVLERGGGELHIARSLEDDFGNYTCALAGRDAPARAWAVRGRAFAKLPAHTNVVEGQKVKIVCKLIGKPYPRVEWTWSEEMSVAGADQTQGNFTDVRVALGARVTLAASEAGVPDGVLVLEAAARADAGRLRCAAPGASSAPHAAVTVLRVKDMYAALWPFLGICAEVFVLCAIILVYEKRRTKPELDDSDTDNHDQKKS